MWFVHMQVRMSSNRLGSCLWDNRVYVRSMRAPRYGPSSGEGDQLEVCLTVPCDVACILHPSTRDCILHPFLEGKRNFSVRFPRLRLLFPHGRSPVSRSAGAARLSYGINGNIRAVLMAGRLFLEKVTVIWDLQGSAEVISSRGGGSPRSIRFLCETQSGECFLLETAVPNAALERR